MVVESLKVLDLERPIREADITGGPFRATTGLVRCSKGLSSVIRSARCRANLWAAYLFDCYDPKAAKQSLLNKVDKSNVRFMKCIMSQPGSSLSRFFA